MLVSKTKQERFAELEKLTRTKSGKCEVIELFRASQGEPPGRIVGVGMNLSHMIDAILAHKFPGE